MEKCDSAWTQQMLVPMTDEIVDVRQPGLDRYERNGVRRIDKQLRPVMTSRGHNIVEGSRFPILGPRHAERGETGRWPDRRCQIAKRHAPQSDGPMLLGHEEREEHRGELVVRNDNLNVRRQCG